MGSDRWGIRTLAAQLISSRRQHIRQLNSSHLVGNISDSSTRLISSAISATAQLISARATYLSQLITSRQVVTTEGSFIRIHSRTPIVIEFTIRGSVTSHEYVICDVMHDCSLSDSYSTRAIPFPYPLFLSSIPIRSSLSKYPETKYRKQKTPHFE